MTRFLSYTSHKIFCLVAILAGVCLTFAFAPFNIYGLAFLAPALLLLSLLNVSAKKAFWRGWLFGLGFFGTGISWVYVSIHVFGNTNSALAGLLTALFVMVLALFPAINAYLVNRFFPQVNPAKLLLAFPILWVLLEWVRSWLFTGFPWLFVGNSQLDLPFNGYVPLVGVYGVSFVVLLVSGLLVYALVIKKRAGVALSSILVLAALGYGLQSISWSTPTGQPLKVTLVQGNVSQKIKWQPNFLDSILKTYEDLTAPHWQDSQLIIWPEAAIPMLAHQAEAFLQTLTQQAVANNVTLITGIPEQISAIHYRNALFVLGEQQGHYYKRHLVPFGEYLPLEPLLRGLINFFSIPMSSFSPGAEQQSNIQAHGLQLSPFICYEIAYPQLVRDSLQGASALLTISDDSWFGRSIAPEQHLQIAQMRSLETARPQLFVTNDGVTAIIDTQGRVQSALPRYQTLVLQGEIQGTMGNTPWVILGSWPILAFLLVLLAIAYIVRNKKY